MVRVKRMVEEGGERGREMRGWWKRTREEVTTLLSCPDVLLLASHC